MKLKIEDIYFDEKTYPRKKIDEELVEDYAEAMLNGDIFPPIKIYKGNLEKEGKLIEIWKQADGRHRILAYKKANSLLKKENKTEKFNEIEVELVKIEKNEKIPFEALELLESAEFNARHGKQLNRKEKRDVVSRVAKLDKLFMISQEKFAKSLGIGQGTVSGWIQELRAIQKEERDFLIYKLHLLGWSQERIAEKVGLSPDGKGGRVSQILNNIESDKIKIFDQFRKQGLSIEEIARRMNTTEILCSAIVLRKEKDIDKFQSFLDESPKIYNIWNFAKREERLGIEYPGNIPGQILMNLLYYYTNEHHDQDHKALVIDPMAGGGSSIDACLVMNRRCLAFDLNPIRDEIIQNDLVANGYPNNIKKADMIFLDPPYSQQKKGEYSNNKTDLSNMNIDEFNRNMKKIFELSYDMLDKNGYLCAIVGHTQEESSIIIDHSFEFEKELLEKYKFVNRIIVPYSTEQYLPYDVSRAKQNKFMLNLYRDLLVFRK